MTERTSKSSAKAKEAAAERAAAKARKPRKTAPKAASKRSPARPQSRASSPAATHRSRRPTATPRCRPTSRPCRGGNATSGAASTRSSCAPSPARARPVKWNSPFYGIEGQGWFLGLHCFTKYVKVAFFRGSSLRPVPPGASKSKDTRYLDIHQDDQLDEELVASWIKQAAALPGWLPQRP